MLRKLLLCLSLLFATLSLAPRARAELRVVATTPDLAALARAVGGSRVRVTSLSLPTQDPHWVDAKPSLALELSNADLLLTVGAGLEQGWLPALQVGSRNGRVQNGSRGFLDCSELVELIERPVGKVDRSMGDIHASGNPHYLFDPRAAERVAVGVAKLLGELDPDGTASYLEETKRFLSSLREARIRWEKQLERAKGRPVVTYHRSLAYLAQWVGLDVVDHVEPKPGIPPDPRHVAELVRHAKERSVRVLLQETWYPTSTSALVAKKVQGKLLRLPGGTNFPAGQTYIGFMDQIAKTLAGAW